MVVTGFPGVGIDQSLQEFLRLVWSLGLQTDCYHGLQDIARIRIKIQYLAIEYLSLLKFLASVQLVRLPQKLLCLFAVLDHGETHEISV